MSLFSSALSSAARLTLPPIKGFKEACEQTQSKASDTQAAAAAPALKKIALPPVSLFFPYLENLFKAQEPLDDKYKTYIYNLIPRIKHSNALKTQLLNIVRELLEHAPTTTDYLNAMIIRYEYNPIPDYDFSSLIPALAFFTNKDWTAKQAHEAQIKIKLPAGIKDILFQLGFVIYLDFKNRKYTGWISESGLPDYYGISQNSALGMEYCGWWSMGRPHGWGVLTTAQDGKYVGKWHQERRDGYGMRYFSDGKIEEYFWTAGEFNPEASLSLQERKMYHAQKKSWRENKPIFDMMSEDTKFWCHKIEC